MAHFFSFVHIALFFVAFIAGIIDTVAGGGGLITVPVLTLSGMSAVTALGTNKLQSAIGELSATIRFWKAGNVDYHKIILGIVFTIVGSSIGTFFIQIVPQSQSNKIIPWLLLLFFIYYIFSPNQNKVSLEKDLPKNPRKLIPMGLIIGFYNGFFGPGTGSIWTISLNRLYNLRINIATMYTKPLNIAGNITALTLFTVGGQVDYPGALAMGIGSFLGGQAGASMVIYKDSRFLKLIFTTIMLLSILSSFIKVYY
ncbi:TSUP family transporter [Saccharibacter sp. 17.LH.SD]|uniref:sulfite exporter TauE/SafE family protein n=1 Tax=Saccharibacter sp. 17.LH.SD TaxID=2689393 RepID=UPI001367A464|nr:TSUP family transporter [Saccharibacter sp. 17.LH.SD]MXV45228.1 TSUP family transporter [Saccharibacter sp. 17.LH.SD]